MQPRLPHRRADPEVPRSRQARPLPGRLPHDSRGQPDAVGHRAGLLPPVRDRLQPRRARRAHRHPRRGAVPRRLRPEARGQSRQAKPAAAERQDGGDRRLGSRRPGLRLPPAPQGLRQRHLRGARRARRHAAGRHPRLAPARGDPRRGDRQAARPGRHRDPLRRPRRRRQTATEPGRTRPPLRRGLPRPRPGRRPAAGRRGRAGPGRDRRAGVPARDRPRPPGEDGHERARHRRRQHGLGRGPVARSGWAGKRRGDDRVPRGRGRTADRGRGPGPGPRGRGALPPADRPGQGPGRRRGNVRGAVLCRGEPAAGTSTVPSPPSSPRAPRSRWPATPSWSPSARSRSWTGCPPTAPNAAWSGPTSTAASRRPAARSSPAAT